MKKEQFNYGDIVEHVLGKKFLIEKPITKDETLSEYKCSKCGEEASNYGDSVSCNKCGFTKYAKRYFTGMYECINDNLEKVIIKEEDLKLVQKDNNK